MTPLAAFALAGCVAIGTGSDRITLGDLAPAFPALASSASDTTVAYAPAPGVQRIFRIPELRRIAARLNLATAPESEICVERAMRPLETQQIIAAMQHTMPRAQIEVLDHFKLPVPEGELRFPISGLRQTPTGELWTGAIQYGGNRRFLIWAKVTLTVRSMRVLAASELKSGQPIDPAQLRTEESEGVPGPFAESIDQVATRIPRCSVKAGTPVRLDWLELAKDVNRGDRVKVEVRSGAAHLEAEAVAEAAAAIGELVPVRNPDSKKSFRARVVAKGRVSLDL